MEAENVEMKNTEPGFDPVAADYDKQFTNSALGRLQRAVVHNYLKTKIKDGAAVLELNCGTGEDAIWLAKQGCTVLATDQSAGMVQVCSNKAEAAHLQHRVQAQVLDIRAIQPNFEFLISNTRFDLILSNFGGLNCLSPDALCTFGQTLPQLLRPGACFVAVVMGRFCVWETSYFLLKGRPKQARRRWDGGPVQAQLDAQTQISTWYYSPAEFCSFFPGLSVQTIQPVGFWLPPSYLSPWASRHPGLLRSLNFLEKKCRGRLWAAAADHFLVVLERTS